MGPTKPPSSSARRIFVMQSSGGITALSTAAREPARTVLSGPAGGAVGAVTTARASGFKSIIAFDMGGTSTDVSLVEGEIKTANDAQIAGLPISVPMLDIHTVGAGGGSWPASMLPEFCVSVQNPPEPIPAPSAMGGELNPPSPMPIFC